VRKNIKKILYIDLDGVVVDFESGIEQLSDDDSRKYSGRYDEAPGIFRIMKPIPGAIDAVRQLAGYFDVFILSTAPWNNHSAWSDKVVWVKKYFGDSEGCVLYKKMILTHRKDLNYGDILIDDRTKNGAGEFKGELIRFGSKRFPNWDRVSEYLINNCR
jgi:5'(3')-deoxyribonucleotidase